MTRTKTGIVTLLLSTAAVAPTALAEEAVAPLTLSSALELFPAFSQHAKRGPMPVMPLYDLTGLPGDWAYKRDEWDPWAPSAGLGAVDSVVNTTRPVVMGFGLTDNGEARQAFVDAKQRVGAFMVRGIGTYKWAGTYQDGDGETVRTGYGRDTEQLILAYTPDADTAVKAIVIRDEIRDNRLPETTNHDPAGNPTIGVDSLRTTRYIGRLMLDKAFEGTLEALHADTRVVVSDRHNSNIDLQPNRQPGQRQDANIERHAIEANLHGDLRLGELPLRLGARGLYENHDGDFATGANLSSLAAIHYPDITRYETALFAESAFDIDVARLDLGLRWEHASTDLGRADDTVTWLNPPGTRVASRTTARGLYQRYAGTDDVDRTNHGISAVARVSRSWLDDALETHLDAGRVTRLPDNQELYFARYHGSPLLRQVGNPDLDPEVHYRVEAGTSYESEGWLAFGRRAALSHDPAFRLSAAVSHDYVDDFISRDRAADNTLVWRNVDASFTSLNASAEWNATRTLSFGLFGRVTWAENLDDDRGLYGIPPAEAVFLADYHDRLSSHGTWNVGLKVRAVADPSDADDDLTSGTGADPEDIDGFTVVDIHGGVQLHDRIGMRLGVSNIFNTEYAELVPQYVTNTPNPAPTNAPGRTFYLWTVVNF